MINCTLNHRHCRINFYSLSSSGFVSKEPISGQSEVKPEPFGLPTSTLEQFKNSRLVSPLLIENTKGFRHRLYICLDKYK